ncbi:MAG: hypothetical protein PHT99_08195, partial [Methanoregula sp.]|nr:hypothetical protein [Methanoregula sp.]
MTPTRMQWVLLAGVVAIAIIMGSAFHPSFFLNCGIVPPVIHTPYGFALMTAAIPDAPSFVPMYRGILREGDRLDLDITSNMTGQLLISSGEAPTVAESLLDNYGGIPSDAEPPSSSTRYGKLINGTSGEIIQVIPEDTSVCFYRTINHLPVVGHGDRICVDVLADGDIWINKKWRTLEYTGTNSTIITPPQG